MGWHQGAIVLAVVPGGPVIPVTRPSEWHVVNATTANRLATIPGSAIRCLAGFWQSPAGVACSVDNTIFVHDLGGKTIGQDSYALSPEQTQPFPSGASAGNYFNGGE